MSRKIKPATIAQVHKLEAALGFLNKARDCLRAADCPKTLQRVRAAIDSGDGAYRHIRHRLHRTQDAARATVADDAIAEWVGLHYHLNFDAMNAIGKADWRQRYAASHA